MKPEELKKHGLNVDEYERILQKLGREPTPVEIGVFGVMWSEHCSYKSSRVHLKTLPTTGPRVLIGPGENAGVVDIGDNLGVVFKMESHNHPSYIEPYQGAATGVGGIMRDVFTMGARPVALLNSLRFGRLEHPKTRSLVHGVVAGIAGYGNCMGVPTVGGETRFDASYDGNCLVNAFCAGLIHNDRIFLGKAAGVGNPVFYVGARTGRDGIHGATMASESFGEGSEEKRPTVQVGDPFQEKLLLEACLELMAEDAIVGIQDMGAAGLTSSSVEMAGRGGAGLKLELDKVPMREVGMTPYEILLSESQERMLMVLEKGKEAAAIRIFEKWDLQVAEVGVVTDDGVWRCFWHGQEVAAIPVSILTEDAPVYRRPMHARPPPPEVPELVHPDANEVLKILLSDPDVCEKRWIWRQYDHQVGTDTVIGPGADAALLRIKGTLKHLAFTAECNGRHVGLDPYLGTMGQVVEAARNLACVGAEGIGLTDCLNFGNPERPEVMWAFAESIRGMGDACRMLGIPVVSGNVSLYNETEGQGILPTPGLAMVGLLEGKTPTVKARFGHEGLKVGLIGVLTTRHLGGSLYLRAVHGLSAGSPPPVSPSWERRLHEAVRELIREELVEVVHDASDGGLAVALAECCMGGVGVIAEGSWDVPSLFGEAHGRVILGYKAELEETIREKLSPDIAFASLGTTIGTRLELGPISVDVAEIKAIFEDTFPGWVG
jgi:phosphoribosylformylglycinamidine synthase